MRRTVRAIVQRVNQASVQVNGEIVGSIEKGLLVYLGVEAGDIQHDLDYLADKIVSLRIFEDAAGKMNLDVKQVDGKVLVLSAFSLLADARKGRRPSFDRAAEPATARQLYDELIHRLRKADVKVETGTFKEHMSVCSDNDGPICILLDSRKLF
jgi:D-tyrosyl-tRNA(Tyr) deacylase